MTPLDEAPEQRWRRTVDRRNRPAKLKVDRLLRDFGYAELDPEVGDAIEARLAGVSLAVAPSLRHAGAGEVVTIYANDSAAPEEGRAAAEQGAVDPALAEEPAVSDVAQMVTYLKEQVLDARAEAERLRTELDRRIAARMDSERENEAIIAEQAAALETQSRQLAELGAALNSTRQALAETRDEIRRAVGELQALPGPSSLDRAPPPFSGVEPEPPAAYEPAAADEDEAGDFGLSGEEWADGREAAAAASLSSEPLPDEGPDRDADTLAPPAPAPAPAGDAESDIDDPALAAVRPAPDLEDLAVSREEPGLAIDEPALGAEEQPVAEVPDQSFDLDEPALGAEELPVAEVPDPPFDLDEPAVVIEKEPVLGEPELDVDQRAAGSAAAVPGVDESDVKPPPPAAEAPVLVDVSDWQPEIPAMPGEPATELHPVSDQDELGTVPPVDAERSDDLAAPLPPPDEWLPAALRPQGDAGSPAAEPLPVGASEPETDGDRLTDDFDDFLYDADELYDPNEPDRAPSDDAPLESEIEARWPDEPAAALPPPPPAPPSPFADELEPPAVAERATLGKVLRGRGGRSRGRWDGSCSICGRLPQVTRRKDLQAAGWDLDDDAAACPQCRGVG